VAVQRRTRSSAPPKPTPDELRAAEGKTVRDLIAPGLRVVFCGINPGLYTAAIGHHFGRPGNRFWPTLHAAGFTPRVLAPWEEAELMPLGYGITNVVARATTAAAELAPAELVAGGRRLRAKMSRYKPAVLAILGVGAYRTAFGRTKASIGLQEETVGETKLWVLPNPSGLNANYKPADFVRLFAELRIFAEGTSRRLSP
jgi:TDG/mug DNA glycosylase family protein